LDEIAKRRRFIMTANGTKEESPDQQEQQRIQKEIEEYKGIEEVPYLEVVER